MSDQPIELKTQKSAKVLAELTQIQTQGIGGTTQVIYQLTNGYENIIKKLLVEIERLQAKCEKEGGLSTGKNRAERRRAQKKITKK